MTIINFKNPVTNETRQAPVGFSWTTLLFGFCVPLFRGDFLNSIIQFVLMCLTGGISMLVFCTIYNKQYIKSLVSKGFEASDEESKRILGIVTI
jgi:hypothetical protein